MLNPAVFATSINKDIKNDRKLVRKVGRALLFYGLNKLDIKVDSKILLATKGKPYFPGNPVFFNISHSMDKLIVAIYSKPIGIDIEFVRENKEKIAKRFFSKGERNYLSGISPKEFAEEFTGIWTKKESYIKMTGDGFSTPLDSFDVFSMNGSCYFKEIKVFDNYKCHLATTEKVDNELCIEKVDYDLYIIERLEDLND